MSWFKKLWDEMSRPLSQCSYCAGTGKKKIGMMEVDCPICQGTGKNKAFEQSGFQPKEPFEPFPSQKPFETFSTESTCSDCDGKGWVYISKPSSLVRGNKRHTCPICGGKGVL